MARHHLAMGMYTLKSGVQVTSRYQLCCANEYSEQLAE